MMPFQAISIPIVVTLFSLYADWFYNPTQPKLLVNQTDKIFDCEDGRGYSIESGTLLSPKGAHDITALLFVQTYGNQWEEKSYAANGNTQLDLALESCNYTGNHYAFAYYTDDKPPFVPAIPDVLKKHRSRGSNPAFKVTKKYASDGCSGVVFEEGMIFTPGGEEVKITLFMEKKDGHWRKKDFLFVGTGKILLDTEGCDLTGEHKSDIVINKHLF